jgi:hypothetical protein
MKKFDEEVAALKKTVSFWKGVYTTGLSLTQNEELLASARAVTPEDGDEVFFAARKAARVLAKRLETQPVSARRSTCCDCGREISWGSRRCYKCAGRVRRKVPAKVKKSKSFIEIGSTDLHDRGRVCQGGAPGTGKRR